ncbi:hypothetical protein BO86DRAFT_392835, partial [Aspergillus japonicus CBS 114.51]
MNPHISSANAGVIRTPRVDAVIRMALAPCALLHFCISMRIADATIACWDYVVLFETVV